MIPFQCYHIKIDYKSKKNKRLLEVEDIGEEDLTERNGRKYLNFYKYFQLTYKYDHMSLYNVDNLKILQQSP